MSPQRQGFQILPSLWGLTSHTHTQMSKFGVGELHLFCLLWSRHYKLWNITI